jgi:peptide subunit release factor 1 (eRF1)
VVPLVKEQLPQRLLDKLVDIVRLEQDVSEDELLRATLDTLHEQDAADDIAAVEEVVGQWQASGLGVVGPEATLQAFTVGQVDELLITGTPDSLKPVQRMPGESSTGEVVADTSAPSGATDESRMQLAAELINRAHQTGARVRFIENADLLREYGGVAASLRFRI